MRQQEPSFLACVERLRESAAAEARWVGAEPPTEQELQEMEREFEQTRNAWSLIVRAYEGRTGLAFDDGGRLQECGLPAARNEQLVERQLWVDLPPEMSMGAAEALHFALRGGVGRPLTLDEPTEVVNQALAVQWDMLFWCGVIDGEMAVDITQQPYAFRILDPAVELQDLAA